MLKQKVHIYGVININVTRQEVSKEAVTSNQYSLHMNAGQTDVIVQLPMNTAENLVDKLTSMLGKES